MTSLTKRPSLILSQNAFNVSTNKYLLVLENATLLFNDTDNKRITIEIEKDNALIPLKFESPRFNNPILSTPTFNRLSPLPSISLPQTLFSDADKKNDDNISPLKIFAPKTNYTLPQSATSPLPIVTNNVSPPVTGNNTNKYKMSLYIMDIKSPKNKINHIRRLLNWNNLSIRDIECSFQAKYTEKYQIICNNNLHNGLQGIIQIVECINNTNHSQYIMKSMKYSNLSELKQHLFRYLIVCENKLMDYKDIFIDTKKKIIYIIQILLKQTLREYICNQANKQLTNSKLKQFIFQLINKLNKIHSCGYVHHDITPENIMFDDNDNLYIIDYDLMNKIGEKVNMKGSIGFIAPELCCITRKRKIHSTCEMDLWSIGSIICYTCFRGKIPFMYNMNIEQNWSNLLKYVQKYSFLDESKYRENKWSFIVDIKLDYGDDYDDQIFQLIGDLLSYDPSFRPNCKKLLTDDQYQWLHQL